jgi:hypothetical protein
MLFRMVLISQAFVVQAVTLWVLLTRSYGRNGKAVKQFWHMYVPPSAVAFHFTHQAERAGLSMCFSFFLGIVIKRIDSILPRHTISDLWFRDVQFCCHRYA